MQDLQSLLVSQFKLNGKLCPTPWFLYFLNGKQVLHSLYMLIYSKTKRALLFQSTLVGNGKLAVLQADHNNITQVKRLPIQYNDKVNISSSKLIFPDPLMSFTLIIHWASNQPLWQPESGPIG